MKRMIWIVAMLVVATFALGGCLGPDVVENESPVAAITYVQDGFDFVFSASSSFDLDGTVDITMCNWWFGDGGTSGGMDVAHTYSNAGTYTVRLVVYDNDGAREETTIDVAINTPSYPPVASFYCFPQSTQTGSSVAFNGKRSSDRDGKIMAGRWDFGDGESASGGWVHCYVTDPIGHPDSVECFSVNREVEHTYQRVGHYVVTLTVWDDEDNSDTTSHTVVIR